ncbi:MAG: hypothetical protein M3T49_07740 [Candidatus Eremiobacteraeota bacterium]|nr:hypothetical protein [Candidatus Eremiobacteraeota bacterium]
MAQPAPTTLVIYHTSDIHDRRGFGQSLAKLVEPTALLVDCGDALRGSSTVFFDREPIARDFAAAPYCAGAVGNREFHYRYRWFLARARALPMPLVCSNLVDLRGRSPCPFERALFVNGAGRRVRLLGVMPPQYRTGSCWERLTGWRFLDPHVALAALLEAPPQSDLTVILSHLGLGADRKLAAAFPQIGAILGGHSHDTLAQPEFVRGVPIAHAGPYGRCAGRLELTVDAGRSRFISYRLVPLSGVHRAA